MFVCRYIISRNKIRLIFVLITSKHTDTLFMLSSIHLVICIHAKLQDTVTVNVIKLYIYLFFLTRNKPL